VTHVRIASEPGSPDSEIDGYLAVPPTGDGPWPAVVVVQDAFGLGGAIRAHADRLAAAGYLAVAPDLYSRGGMLRCVQQTFRSMTTRSGQAYEDIEAARRFALERRDCSGKVGVIGFCMGGGFALGLVDRGFDVSAPNYGQLPRDLDRLFERACPVVASYGGRDRTLRGTAATLEAELSARGIPHDVKEYPDAGHGFMERHNLGPAIHLMRVAGLGYHHDSAEDAWGRILRFFGEHLAGTVPD
jgi:carboxymethylenebutenolidase